ncbi:c-type cytochrome biogenesis protein CcsB [Gordonia araii]|nr:c-type cytochrome biogenesis protein CcsB [Gordonia araii]NNG97843.1 c-type cytochrome biogenesis protein CcsB [Gordonia araii NBRC 100433]
MLANTGEVTVHIDETVAGYSQVLYGTAVGVYALATLLLIAAYAATLDRFAGQRVSAARELVGAGAPVVAAGDNTPGRVVEEQRRPRSQVFANMGYAVAVVGIIAHFASLVTRGIATDRMPWGNMFEFISLTSLACMIGGVVALREPANRKYLGFVSLVVVVLLFIGLRFLYTDAAPVVPALKSYWLIIHVSIISIASGVLLVSGVASILYLLAQRFGIFGEDAVDRLDRIAYRCVIFAFPLFSLGVICGAIWAEAAWGRFWGWDPKETVSFISWVIYAAYLHARATAGWRNNAAVINVIGFASVLFNLFAINLVVSGLHSYAGV